MDTKTQKSFIKRFWWLALVVVLVAVIIGVTTGIKKNDTTDKEKNSNGTINNNAPAAGMEDTNESSTPLQFSYTIVQVTADEQSAMLTSGSWHQGCPVPITELRTVTLSYWGFDGAPHQGKLVVQADVADDIVSVFRALYNDHFPIHRMELIDAFNADDEKSMQADNTSAFNCRTVAGSSVWSQHAYGRAVDVNPMENPSVSNGVADPATAQKYIDRTLNDAGMIKLDNTIVNSFKSIGWSWGGEWAAPSDYMHFSLTGT